MSDDRPRCPQGHLIRHRVSLPDECRGRNCEFNQIASAEQLQLPPDFGDGVAFHQAYTPASFYTGPSILGLAIGAGFVAAAIVVLILFG